MIDGITTERGQLELPADRLHSGYLGERVLVSTNGKASGVIGTITGFKMTKPSPVANSDATTQVKVSIDGSKYLFEHDQRILFLGLANELPIP